MKTKEELRDKARTARETMLEMRRDYDDEVDLPADFYDDDSDFGRALSGLREVEEYLGAAGVQREPEGSLVFVGMDAIGSRGSLDYDDPISGVVTFLVEFPFSCEGSVRDDEEDGLVDEPRIINNEDELRAWAAEEYDFFDLRRR